MMPPTQGSITSITASGLGSGYTTATVTISPPDSAYPGTIQATATAIVGGGQVTGYVVTNAGWGYVAPPTITIVGDGTGAEGTAVVTNRIMTVPSQEIYSIS